jgi:hypothetical protein
MITKQMWGQISFNVFVFEIIIIIVERLRVEERNEVV